MNKNQVTQRIHVHKGLSLYKTGRSPYYFARIWDPINKKYLTRSTKETTRIDAREVALISGHKDVRQLFRYTHLKPENLIAKYSSIFKDSND